MKIILRVSPNQGYGPEQVKGIKVLDLKELLEQYNDDDEIITLDGGNRYGAKYGKLYAEVEDIYEDEEE